MSVKQIKWHVAVLAVTVFAALTVLFALTTVTSHADTSYDPGTRTYTMTGGTYAEQIVLDSGATTTINVSGENTLTYSNYCIRGNGDLKITGSGTLYIPNSYSECKNLTIESGVKLKLGRKGMRVNGNVTVNGAEIESEHGYFECGGYSSTSKHIFTNAQLKFGHIQDASDWDGLYVCGETVLTNCNVTIEDTALTSEGGQLTIDGGTYNCTMAPLMSGSGYSPLYSAFRAVIKNAVIKSNAHLHHQNLEMSNSDLEITLPEMGYQSYPGALEGDNLVIVGSKVKIDGEANAGIFANQQLIMIDTEADVKGSSLGIFGGDVTITRSSGTFQAISSDEAIAAVVAVAIGNSQSPEVKPGKITLNSVYIKEPAGGTVAQIQDPTSPGSTNMVTVIVDGDNPAKKVVLESEHKTHTWDAGKVTKEPTETAEGVKTYTCTVCGATKTEAIPKLTPQTPKTPENGADGTPFGKGASVAAAEAAILALPNDNDPAGTAFGLIQLKASKVTKNSISLKWKAVPGATKYILFANKCGTGNKYKKLGEVTGTSYTATQAAGAAIQKGTYYKFMMIAADANGKVVSTSKTVHAATKGGKIGNHKKVTVKKAVTKKAKKLKVGKTLKLKAKAVPQAKKLKVRKHRGIMYETSNPAVAQVNGKGAVKGVGKGACYIYAYAQNGTCAKVKVTVK